MSSVWHRRVYVGNLDPQTSAEELKVLFSDHGVVQDVFFETGAIHGFIQFARADQARFAAEKLDGFNLQGIPLKAVVASDHLSAFKISAGAELKTTPPQQSVYARSPNRKTFSQGEPITTTFSLPSHPHPLVPAASPGKHCTLCNQPAPVSLSCRKCDFYICKGCFTRSVSQAVDNSFPPLKRRLKSYVAGTDRPKSHKKVWEKMKPRVRLWCSKITKRRSDRQLAYEYVRAVILDPRFHESPAAYYRHLHHERGDDKRFCDGTDQGLMVLRALMMRPRSNK